jgi:hypothetical protein
MVPPQRIPEAMSNGAMNRQPPGARTALSARIEGLELADKLSALQTHRSRKAFLILTELLLLLAASCSTPPPVVRSAISTSVRAEIYERPNQEFTLAAFFKPLETGRTNLPTFTFAPLILQEIPEGSSNSPAPSIATVYFRADRIPIHGRLHDQFTYLWVYDAGTAPEARSGLRRQGIRITLDSAGEPAIWEVLADSSGARILFVSESIEEDAVAAFKKPSSGRRFACERDVREGPDTIVAQTIPEGPVPMGPIVYLGALTHDVCSIVCRCMASQAGRLAGQNDFTLEPWDAELGSWEQSRDPTGAAPEAEAAQTTLEQSLRLPEGF